MNIMSYADAIGDWIQRVLGKRNRVDPIERLSRLFEEACEVAQAGGLGLRDARLILDHVYSRPVGGISQEIGGLMTTIVTYCAAIGLDPEEALGEEAKRILALDPAKVRAAQERKHKAGIALPCSVEGFDVATIPPAYLVGARVRIDARPYSDEHLTKRIDACREEASRLAAESNVEGMARTQLREVLRGKLDLIEQEIDQLLVERIRRMP